MAGFSAIGFTITIFVLAGVFAPSDSSSTPLKSNSPTSTIKPTSNLKVSPTPSDPCSDYAGSDQYIDCINMQSAAQKGSALQHPLKATVTHDGLHLYITNNENVVWNDCTATLDDYNPSADNYISDSFSLQGSETETIGWGNFANAENQRFNYFQTKPTFVDLDCSVNGQEHRSNFNL